MNNNFDLKYLRFGGRFSKINTSCDIRSASCCFSTFSTLFFIQMQRRFSKFLMMDNEIRISWSFYISFLLNIRLRFMLAALHACFCFFLFGFQTNGLLNHERQYVQKKYFEDNTEADFTKNKQLQNNILLLSFICVFHSGYKKHLPSNTFVKSFTFVF